MNTLKQSISHRPENRTVTDIQNLFEANLLNLEPGFQRQSVWSERDRVLLCKNRFEWTSCQGRLSRYIRQGLGRRQHFNRLLYHSNPAYLKL